MNFGDLAEHTGTLIALIAILGMVCAALIGAVYKVALTLKADILEMVKELKGSITEVWGEIKKIKDSQLYLREKLPAEYLRIEGPGYKILVSSLERIEDHLEKFMEDCRQGKCPNSKKNPLR